MREQHPANYWPKNYRGKNSHCMQHQTRPKRSCIKQENRQNQYGQRAKNDFHETHRSLFKEAMHWHPMNSADSPGINAGRGDGTNLALPEPQRVLAPVKACGFRPLTQQANGLRVGPVKKTTDFVPLRLRIRIAQRHQLGGVTGLKQQVAGQCRAFNVCLTGRYAYATEHGAYSVREGVNMPGRHHIQSLAGRNNQ